MVRPSRALCWAGWNQSTFPCTFNSMRWSLLITLPQSLPAFPICVFLSSFPTKIWVFLFLPVRAACVPLIIPPPWFDHVTNVSQSSLIPPDQFQDSPSNTTHLLLSTTFTIFRFVEWERKPTRCNNQMFIISTVSTCFGHHYAHLQENKDRVLLHVVCCAGSAGCGW